MRAIESDYDRSFNRDIRGVIIIIILSNFSDREKIDLINSITNTLAIVDHH